MWILSYFFILKSHIHLLHCSYLIQGTSPLVHQVFNFSTGRIINKTVFDSEVTSMDHDHTGQLIFCGDGQVWSFLYILYLLYTMNSHVPLVTLLLGQYMQGCIYSVSMNSHTGALSRSHRHRSTSRRKSPVTTVQYKSFSLLARGPVLLTCTRDGSLSFFRSGQLIYALQFQGHVWLMGMAMKEWKWDTHIAQTCIWCMGIEISVQLIWEYFYQILG